MSRKEGTAMMKNIARLLLYLVASATLVAAATTEQMPKGITVASGQTLDLTGRTVQTPTVVVNSGGTLLLSGTTLIMDGASNGTANIWVKDGTMKILAASEIKSANANRYTFWVDAGSTFEMRDSTMSGCGYESSGDSTKGMLIKASGAILENNDFGINYVCVILDGTSNVKITSNRFNNCEYQAASVSNSNSAEISSNVFSKNYPTQYSVRLSSCLNAAVFDNTFDNSFGIGLLHTNASVIRKNNFNDPTGPSIMISTDYHDSKENLLENNTIAGRLKIEGFSNIIKGGSVGTELFIGTAADNNAFEGVQFTGTDMTLNSQSVTGTTFDNNVFDGTAFSEDNAVITLESNNTVHKATFGKNVSIIMTGIQNVVDNVTIQDCAGILIGVPYINGAGAWNTLSNSVVVLNFASGHGIVCDGPCLIANCTITDTNTLAQQATERQASLTGLVAAGGVERTASVSETAPKKQSSNGVQGMLLLVAFGAAALFAFWALRRKR